MTSRRAKIAADDLRWYANYLRNTEGRLRSLQASLDGGRLPVDAWGVHVFQGWDLNVSRGVHGNLPDPEDGSMKGGFVDAEATPELRAFRTAYEAAHDAQGERLKELADIYAETAAALDVIADRSDRQEESGGDLLLNKIQGIHE